MVIQLYNAKHEKTKIIEVQNATITQEIADSNFNCDIDIKYLDYIQEEGYIRTKEQEYVIVNTNIEDNDLIAVEAVLNLEELVGKPIESFSSKEQLAVDCIKLAIAGTGWTIEDKSNVTRKRTIRKDGTNALEIIKQCMSTYRIEVDFNTINKKITLYERLGQDKGFYAMEDFNAKAINISSNTDDFYTYIEAFGKAKDDGTQIHCTVENYSYSTKKKGLYWKDERYTILEDLKEDAEYKLSELCKPKKSYTVSLAELNMDIHIGDTITLISKDKKIKDKQRVVKITSYPDNESENTIEIANRSASFEEVQRQQAENDETLNNITEDNGTISIKAMQDGWIELNNVNIQGLNAVKASIGDLEANKANVDDLKATNANIDKLKADKADITDLNATNAEIDNLKAKDAQFDVALANKVDTTTLTAYQADVTKLFAKKADVTDLTAQNLKFTYGTGNELTLQELLTNIVSATDGQVLNLTSQNVVLANAIIKDAMVDTISANKLVSGSIDTGKVNIQSSDGNMTLTGSLLQFKDENGNIRIQMGLDGNKVYSIKILDANGNIQFDTTGVTADGLNNGIITDSKVADNANINGKKIDIASLITEINNGTSTIKASNILLDTDKQTLDVAFNEMKSNVNNLQSGSRNLVKNSCFKDDLKYWSYDSDWKDNLSIDDSTKFNGHKSLKISATGLTENRWIGVRQRLTSLPLRSGETYYISCYYYCADKSTFDASFSLELKGKKLDSDTIETAIFKFRVDKDELVEKKWTRISIKATLTNDWTYAFIYPWVEKNGTIWITDIMVTNSNVLQDWNLAPEDIESKIETNTTSINTQQGQIDTLIKNTVITEDGKTTQLKDAYTALKQTVGEISQKATKVETDFNNIQVGGTNLLRHSRTFESGKREDGYWSGDTWNKTVNSDGFTEIQISATGLTSDSIKSYYSNFIPIQDYLNKDIILSFEMKVKSFTDWDTQRPFVFEYYDKDKNRIAWTDVVINSCTPTTLSDDTWTKIAYKRKVDNNMNWLTDKTIDDVVYFDIRFALFKNGDISFRKPCLLQTNVNSNYVENPLDIEERNNENIGKTVASTVTEYYVSTSNSTTTGGSWSTDSPKWSSGKYIWSRNKTTLRNGTVEYSTAVCIQGAKGETGSTGATGKGIVSITPEYYMSTSKTTQTGGSWVTSCPQWEANHYLWTRSKVTYTDNTTEYVGLQVDSSWEAVNLVEVGGRNLYLGTKDFTGSKWIQLNGWTKQDEKYKDLTVYSFTGQRNGLYEDIEVKAGETYTLSAYMKTNGEVHFYSDIAQEDGTKPSDCVNNQGILVTTSSDWVRVSATFTCNYDGTLQARFENSIADKTTYICGLKLEKGTKATDYSEAPEDTQSQIDNVVQRVSTAEQKITPTEIINSINTALTDSKGNSKIDTTSTVLDKNGLTVNNGYFKVINTKGVEVLKANENNNGNLYINGVIEASTEDTTNGTRRVTVNTDIPPVFMDFWGNGAWEKDKKGVITGIDLYSYKDDLNQLSLFMDSNQANYNYLYTKKPLYMYCSEFNVGLGCLDGLEKSCALIAEGGIEVKSSNNSNYGENGIVAGNGAGGDWSSGHYQLGISADNAIGFGSNAEYDSSAIYPKSLKLSALINTRTGEMWVEKGKKVLADGGNNLSGTGHQRLNNGFNIQWGTFKININNQSSATGTTYFSTAFGTSIFAIVGNIIQVDSSSLNALNWDFRINAGSSTTKADWSLKNRSGGTASFAWVSYIAIGY